MLQIRSAYKRKGYGHLQLQEAIHRISSYAGLKKIIVCTNSNLVAPRNYESVGFKLFDKKKNDSESAYTGDYLYYEIILKIYMKSSTPRLSSRGNLN
ncbi:MAG: GNAT family N-acetyltransferase [Lachnospiraceae bacterium]